MQEQPFVKGLARAFQIHLLASDMTLLEQFRLASTQARQEAIKTLYPFAQRLWQQIQTQEVVRSFVIQNFAQQTDKPYSHLAKALLPSIKAELLEVFRQALQHNTALQLSVHPTSYACARYLASLVRVWPPKGRYVELLGGAGVTTAEHVEVAWQRPDPPEPNLTAVQHELRAKTLLLLVALAATQAETKPGQAVYVGLSDLMGYFGYRLGAKANARYYWFHAAEVVRALLHDLPGHQVRIGDQTPRPLLAVPQVVFRNPQKGRIEPMLPADDLCRAVREADILGFFVRFEPEILDLLGVAANRPTRQVPAAFCSLHGSCFWMAWQVVHGQHRAERQSVNLLRLLEDYGYLEAHTRKGRTRYKDALKAWWADVGLLVEIGLLQEPGVRICGRKREVSDHLSRQLETSGRISPRQLEQLEAVFAPSH